MDGQTDRPSSRDAWTHLKISPLQKSTSITRGKDTIQSYSFFFSKYWQSDLLRRRWRWISSTWSPTTYRTKWLHVEGHSMNTVAFFPRLRCLITDVYSPKTMRLKKSLYTRINRATNRQTERQTEIQFRSEKKKFQWHTLLFRSRTRTGSRQTLYDVPFRIHLSHISLPKRIWILEDQCITVVERKTAKKSENKNDPQSIRSEGQFRDF